MNTKMQIITYVELVLVCSSSFISACHLLSKHHSYRTFLLFLVEGSVVQLHRHRSLPQQLYVLLKDLRLPRFRIAHPGSPTL